MAGKKEKGGEHESEWGATKLRYMGVGVPGRGDAGTVGRTWG